MKVNITETVLRDANQSLIATRMPFEDFEPVLEKSMKQATLLLNVGEAQLLIHVSDTYLKTPGRDLGGLNQRSKTQSSKCY